MRKFLNEKGQEYAGFQLLIDIVMALAILVIILSVINYFEEQKIIASQRAFLDKMQSAVNAPNQGIIKADNLILPQGVISAEFIAANTPVKAKCVEFTARPDSAFTLASDKTFVKINQKIEADIFLKCIVGSQYGSAVDCSESCLISIGREIKED